MTDYEKLRLQIELINANANRLWRMAEALDLIGINKNLADDLHRMSRELRLATVVILDAWEANRAVIPDNNLRAFSPPIT